MTPLDAPSRNSRKQRPHSSYNRTPVTGSTQFAGIPIQCQYCSGQAFRRSRLRSEDFWQMVLMRYPVRCLRCRQRQMVSFTVAGISTSSLTRQQSHPVRTQDTWKNWTEPSGDKDSSSHIAIQPPRRDE